MHELPSPISSQVPVGLEAANAANALFDEKALLEVGFYDELHSKEEINAAIATNNAAFDTLVSAAGSLIGKESLLAREDTETQRLFLTGNERLRSPGIVLRTEVAHEAAQSDETLQQIAENRVAIREGINQAFRPYIQAFLDKLPQPKGKPSRIARNKSRDWEVPNKQGGHRFTMNYREDAHGVHMASVECVTLPSSGAVEKLHNLSARHNARKISAEALFPPCAASCQFEKGEPVELSLEWPNEMFDGSNLQSLAREGKIFGRHDDSELRQPSTVLHDIGQVAQEAGLGRSRITLNLRGQDPTIVVKKKASGAISQGKIVNFLLANETEIGGYTYDPQTNQFEAHGQPFPAVPGTQFPDLVTDILRYFPTVQER